MTKKNMILFVEIALVLFGFQTMPKAFGASTTYSGEDRDEWQVVGFWDYDGVDGQQLVNGLVLRNTSGAGLGQNWKSHLELKTHDSLPTRKRTLWPVKINADQRKVCVNYPNYPSYQAFIDMPGENADGFYSFGQCNGGS